MSMELALRGTDHPERTRVESRASLSSRRRRLQQMRMPTSRRYPYLPEVLGLMLVAALAVAATMVAGGEAPAGTPVPETAPSGVVVDPLADLQSTIARVRHLYFGRDFHHGAAEGDAALQRWPGSSELVAWTVANLARSQNPEPLALFPSVGADEGVARAESLMESRPDDVWGAIALALALTHHSDRRGEALEASLRPLELAPTLPEAVWARAFILHHHQQYQEVSALIEETWPVVDRQWAELLTIRGDAYLARTADEMGPERLDEGLEILARAREHDPENVNAHYLAGVALQGHGRRVDEVAPLLERAAVLSPGSIEIATSHWRTISNDPDLDAEEKKALISASADELLERRGQYPSTLMRVAQHLGSVPGLKAKAAELQDRMLTDFAQTAEAELVLSNQWANLYRRIVDGQVEDTLAARAELSSILWSFIDRPHHHQTAVLGRAYYLLFSHVQPDETVSADTLLLLARGAVEHGRDYPGHAEVATGLADRGAHLDAARQIARDGIDAAEEHVARRMELYVTPGAAADALDRSLVSVYTAIGHVELKAGDLVAAREAIDHALELKSDDFEVQLRAGALAEAEGDLEAAKIHYASGERLERLGWGDKPNREALERIHTELHGSMEGYEEFIAGIEEGDRARRRQEIADSRIEEPRDLPAIDLEWLDGGRIGADELEGRIVVINFWGVWCAPCVAEAPQIQQLHEKYRDDPGVVFLTIDAFDPDLDEVRTWMADNEYDYPVLVDDGFVTRHGVPGYPTTWFADTDGQIVFEYTGDTAAVYEEFVWRVEMLQAEAGAEVAGGAE